MNRRNFVTRVALGCLGAPATMAAFPRTAQAIAGVGYQGGIDPNPPIWYDDFSASYPTLNLQPPVYAAPRPQGFSSRLAPVYYISGPGTVAQPPVVVSAGQGQCVSSASQQGINVVYALLETGYPIYQYDLDFTFLNTTGTAVLAIVRNIADGTLAEMTHTQVAIDGYGNILINPLYWHAGRASVRPSFVQYGGVQPAYLGQRLHATMTVSSSGSYIVTVGAVTMMAWDANIAGIFPATGAYFEFGNGATVHNGIALRTTPGV
jgi:hypothetical protein